MDVSTMVAVKSVWQTFLNDPNKIVLKIIIGNIC